ncbi:MAG: histidinol-phosphate transaminase [Syntrophobacterales bacterium]|nr:histidinol-phosphate transaminase [Syntrophobacterales bacterium]
MDIKSVIKEEVLAHQAYPVENARYPVKLDANENPLTISAGLRAEFAARLAEIFLNRYPEAGAPSLSGRFAESFGVKPEQVIIGNGSDELIQILCSAVARPGAEVMIPTPTFAMYRISPVNAGCRVVEVPLDGAFDLDVAAMSAQSKAHPPALAFLASPNNPTGNCFSRDRIAAIIESFPGIVVVDEAYQNFCGQTFLPLLAKYDNLVILRTLSKIGFAAARLGLLVGSPELVYELNKVRLPYNLSALSQAAAGFYLDHEEVFLKQAEEIRLWREELYAELLAIAGIKPWRSDANFIFFSCDFDSDRIYSELLAGGVLVKNFNMPGRIKNFMRVTVGTPEENGIFIKKLKEILQQLGA